MLYQGSLESFIEHPVWGLDKFIKFYNLWAEQRLNCKKVALIRYEDLKLKTEYYLNWLLKFLNVKIDEKLVKEAVEYSSFNNMRAMEEKGISIKYKSTGLNIFATGDKNNPNAFHVRRGKVGGYREMLKQTDIAKYEKRIAIELNHWYGYNNSHRFTE